MLLTHTEGRWEHDPVNPLGRLALALTALVARVVPRRRRSPEEQTRLERAVAAIDRELAANLELVTMFMQTRQAAVLENVAHGAWRQEIAAADPEVGARLDALYAAIPEAESAMERRGPAASFRREDRAIVERWDGEARTLQRALRRLPSARPASWADRLLVRSQRRFRPLAE
jgi:hypothetical protein